MGFAGNTEPQYILPTGKTKMQTHINDLQLLLNIDTLPF